MYQSPCNTMASNREKPRHEGGCFTEGREVRKVVGSGEPDEGWELGQREF
jgi:hypothetical protein